MSPPSPPPETPPPPDAAGLDEDLDPPLPALRRNDGSDDEKEPLPPIRSHWASDGEGEDEEYEEDEVGGNIHEGIGDGEEGGFEEEESLVDPPVAEAGEGKPVGGASVEEAEGVEGQKLPFQVPTAGPFYMHDDRLSDRGRGRRRHTYTERKVGVTKDEQAWVHDRFEEMNLQEEKRRPGRFRGRGGGRKASSSQHFYNRGGKPFPDNDDGNNESNPKRPVRDRGPRRYDTIGPNEPLNAFARQRQPARLRESASSSSTRTGDHIASPQAVTTHRKHFVASSLNSSSPPFYPSGSPNQDNFVEHRKDIGVRSDNKISTSSITTSSADLHFQSTMSEKKKQNFYSAVHNGTSVDDSPQFTSHKKYNTSSRSMNSGRSSNSWVSGENRNMRRDHRDTVNTSLQNQRPSAPSQRHDRGQVDHRSERSDQTEYVAPVAERFIPPHQHLSENSNDDFGKPSSFSGQRSNNSSSVKGETSIQVTERGPFLNSEAQYAGVLSLPQGDQNFQMLPVVQIGDQHSGGIRVPTVGMAVPGYVASQSGGNPEMTWLPILPGSAGSFGTSYCSPYIAIDPSSFSRHVVRTSPGSSRDAGVGTASDVSPSEGLVSKEVGLHQNNSSKRYSNMKVGN